MIKYTTLKIEKDLLKKIMCMAFYDVGAVSSRFAWIIIKRCVANFKS